MKMKKKIIKALEKALEEVKEENEVLGKIHFTFSLIFMNGIFFPMLIQGLAGVSRRLADGGNTYAHAQSVIHYNEFMSISAFLLALAQQLFRFF